MCEIVCEIAECSVDGAQQQLYIDSGMRTGSTVLFPHSVFLAMAEVCLAALCAHGSGLFRLLSLLRSILVIVDNMDVNGSQHGRESKQ